MTKHSITLLLSRNYFPLFITQFLNAFNDNVFKNAMVVLITYRLLQNASEVQFMIALIGGVFILPFFLFSALAGLIADKFEKTKVIRIIKFAEIFIMLIGSVGFFLNNIVLLMTTLFFLGMHSTFFCPIKYAILPELLNKNELITGNALIEAGTFMAILVGQIVGGSLIVLNQGISFVSLGIIGIAIMGWGCSQFILPRQPCAPQTPISFNLAALTYQIIRYTYQQKSLFLAVLGISWFWFIGATFITQLPSLIKDVLRASSPVFTLFLTVFSIGIGVGSLLCNAVLRGRLTVRYVPLSILCMSIFMIDIYLATPQNLTFTTLQSIGAFLSDKSHFRLIVDVFMTTVCGGFYIVPLYTLLQEYSDPKRRSSVIACNNIINALFMVISSLLIMVLTSLRFTIPQLFLLLAIANLLVALTLWRSKYFYR